MLRLAAVLLVFTQAAPAAHDKAFWRAIVASKFEVPAGASAAALSRELTAQLGSPDPELRDALAFEILTSWIYDRKLLGPDELRPMMATLEGNLRSGIGGTGTDAVLLRSFSALTLSIVAARENAAPFMSPAEYRGLLDAALTYFHDERDLRGFDARRGWMHSAAHTSDLLKFLARHPQLTPADQARVLAAILAKNRDAGGAFAQGEDERMARVVISIVRREDFDRDGFSSWLAAADQTSIFPKAPAVESLRSYQNVRHLLSSLWTELSADERPSEGADFAKSALRGVIGKRWN